MKQTKKKIFAVFPEKTIYRITGRDYAFAWLLTYSLNNDGAIIRRQGFSASLEGARLSMERALPRQYNPRTRKWTKRSDLIVHSAEIAPVQQEEDKTMTNTKHTPGPRRLITYTNVNEERITRVFSAEEFDALDDPADFQFPNILCYDLPMPFAAAPELSAERDALKAELAVWKQIAFVQQSSLKVLQSKLNGAENHGDFLIENCLKEIESAFEQTDAAIAKAEGK